MRPSIEHVRLWFGYDPDRGVLLRKLKYRNDLSDEVPLEKRVYFLGKRYPYSHIIWVVHYGKWPDEIIDHKDHNQLNFKINNLREATQNQNQHNKLSWGPYGKGVSLDDSTYRARPFVARISINSKSIFLGSFATAEEAAEAYRQAAIKYHGEFACV